MNNEVNNIGMGMVIGIAIGTFFGARHHPYIAIGMAVGMAIGIALRAMKRRNLDSN
jgi:uncharacterized membrane protein (Fun14 family)